jgi:hypothetical protein
MTGEDGLVVVPTAYFTGPRGGSEWRGPIKSQAGQAFFPRPRSGWVSYVRARVHGQNMNSSNASTKGLEAFEGLRPSFSAHVRWCEHGASVWSRLVLRCSFRP